MYGTKPPCTFVMLFPVQYMEKRFALETEESFLIKMSKHKNQCVWKKKGRFGYWAENLFDKRNARFLLCLVMGYFWFGY